MVMPVVKKMIDNPGVYICGDTRIPGATVIIISIRGKLFSTMIDEELSPEGFLDTLTVKGPFTAEI